MRVFLVQGSCGEQGLQWGVEGADHGGAIHGFNGAPKGRGHLHQVRQAVDVGGGVVARAVHEGGVEEGRVAGFQRQLRVVVGEILLEFRTGEGDVALDVALRIGQVHGGARGQRHVTMGHSALQGEGREQHMRVDRPLGGVFAGHKAQVIVAVGGLGGAARVHAIDLRGELVVRPKPSGADER